MLTDIAKRTTPYVEESIRLSIQDLRPYLKWHVGHELYITVNEQPRFMFKYTRDTDTPEGAIILRYTTNVEDVTQRIVLQSSKQHFGGKRLWLVCPQCNKRRRDLYFPFHYGQSCKLRFLCRECHGLIYESQGRANSRMYDGMVKYFKRIEFLVDQMDCRREWDVLDLPRVYDLRRPKGMHRSTFNSLLREYHHTINNFVDSFADAFGFETPW